MEILVWIGAALTVAGFVGIVLSIVAIQRARRAGLDDDALRARLQGIVPLNLGSFGLSVIGLMLVVTGTLLA